MADALEKISLVFKEQSCFNPEQATNTFIIGLSDYTECVIFPFLVKEIIQKAPNVNIVVKHVNYINNRKIFEFKDVALSIGIYSSVPDALIAQPLFSENAVCLGAKKNPLLKKPIDAKSFAKAKQLAIQFFENKEELLTEISIKKLGMQRQAIVTHPHALSAPYVLMHTDLVSITLERLAKQFVKKFPLVYQDISFFSAKYTVSMVWHPKDKNNPAHRWLRQIVIDVSKTLI